MQALLVLALAAVASAGLVPATVLTRAPAFDSAVIQSDRLGGNFAYSVAEGHAYAAQTPIVQQVATPVAVSYSAAPVAVAAPAPVVKVAAPVAVAAPAPVVKVAAPVAVAAPAPVAVAAPLTYAASPYYGYAAAPYYGYPGYGYGYGYPYYPSVATTLLKK